MASAPIHWVRAQPKQAASMTWLGSRPRPIARVAVKWESQSEFNQQTKPNVMRL